MNTPQWIAPARRLLNETFGFSASPAENRTYWRETIDGVLVWLPTVATALILGIYGARVSGFDETKLDQFRRFLTPVAVVLTVLLVDWIPPPRIVRLMAIGMWPIFLWLIL